MNQAPTQTQTEVVFSAPANTVAPVEPAAPRARQLVGDVMTRAVVTAHGGAPLKEIAAAMARNHISTVPVIDDDRRVVGVVTAADLLARVSGDHGRPPRGHRLSSSHETNV